MQTRDSQQAVREAATSRKQYSEGLEKARPTEGKQEVAAINRVSILPDSRWKIYTRPDLKQIKINQILMGSHNKLRHLKNSKRQRQKRNLKIYLEVKMMMQ